MEENESDIHPVFKEMQRSGCRSQSKTAVAFQVYMELCEVRGMWDVEYHYNRKLDLHYFTAKNSASSSEQEIFVPISVVADISPATVEEFQDELCQDKEIKSITLAIKEQDSSVVYYTATQGLERPDSPDTSRRKKARHERQHLVRTEINRQRVALYEQAVVLRDGPDGEL